MSWLLPRTWVSLATASTLALVVTSCSLRELSSLGAGSGGGGTTTTSGGGNGGSAGQGGLGGAGGGGAGPVDPLPFCPKEGWCRLKSTSIAANGCPLGDSCDYLFTGNNSGAIDPRTGNLYLWGAGPAPYSPYNAIYRVAPQMPATSQVLPSDPLFDDGNNCYIQDDNSMPAARPVPRQPYGGLTTIPLSPGSGPTDRSWGMFAIGGTAHCPEAAKRTWIYDFEAAAWSEIEATVNGATGTVPNLGNQIKIDYDPRHDAVYLAINAQLWKYDIAEQDYVFLKSDIVNSNYRSVGRIFPDFRYPTDEDAARSVFILMGTANNTPSFVAVLLQNPFPSLDQPEDLANLRPDASCHPLMAASAPALAYHPERKVFVGWPGDSSTVYIYDPMERHCTPLENLEDQGLYPNVPITGSRGAWRYSELLDAFVVVSDWEQEAYVFRLPAE